MTPEPSLDLLRDPVFRIERNDGSEDTVTLPGYLAALVADDVASTVAVQAHQRHTWHATWVQVAAIAMHAAGLSEPPRSEDDWANILEDSVPVEFRDTAWKLVAPYDRPAFMQPPIGEKDRDGGYRLDAASDIEVILLSRNHDIKSGGGRAVPDDVWLAALVSHQTQAGFKGPGNPGILRMNKGFGSRVGFGLVPPGGAGARFVRDAKGHLATRPRMLERGYSEDGTRYQWLEPWEGNEQLAVPDMDPFFVEVCRRIRLFRADDGSLACHIWNNAKTRTDEAAYRGNVGDLWTATVSDKEGIKSFTGDRTGLGYGRMVSLMMGSQTITPSPLTNALPSDPPAGMRFSARVFVRGQGKTEGYYERSVPISRRVSGLMGKPQGEPYGLLARQMVEAAGRVANSVLGVALLKMGSGKPDLDFNDTSAVAFRDAWLPRYHAAVDRVFFETLRHLCDRLGPSTEAECLIEWQCDLYRIARGILDEAVPAAPGAMLQRGRAVARAQTAFVAIYRKKFPEAWARMRPVLPATDVVDAEEAEVEAVEVEEHMETVDE